jgi:hypothetical protein
MLGFLHNFADISFCTYGKFEERQKTMDGKGSKNRFSEQPLCKFGPGGDFVHEMSPKQALPTVPRHENPLGKVLEIIGEMIGAAIGPELLLDQPKQPEKEFNKQTILVEKTKHENNQSGFDYYHPQTTGRTQGNRGVLCQAMLFADDGRDRTLSGRKTTHRIRAHRRTSRKRIDRNIREGQGSGSLFTAYETSKKTA